MVAHAFPPDGVGGTERYAETVARALREGDPAVYVRQNDHVINVSVGFLHDGDEAVVARRLREALEARA